jgi:hypothetical protein
MRASISEVEATEVDGVAHSETGPVLLAKLELDLAEKRRERIELQTELKDLETRKVLILIMGSYFH